MLDPTLLHNRVNWEGLKGRVPDADSHAKSNIHQITIPGLLTLVPAWCP